MKKIVWILLICILFCSCNSDPNWNDLVVVIENETEFSKHRDLINTSFYGPVTDELVADGNGVVVHMVKADSDKIKIINREVDYRYDWYKTFDGVDDPSKIDFYGPIFGYRYYNDLNMVFGVENVYNYNASSDLQSFYSFDFSIPAIKEGGSAPVFEVPWLADNVKDLQNDLSEDAPCGYIYGKVYVGKWLVVSVFTAENSPEARSEVDRLVEKMGLAHYS